MDRATSMRAPSNPFRETGRGFSWRLLQRRELKLRGVSCTEWVLASQQLAVCQVGIMVHACHSLLAVQEGLHFRRDAFERPVNHVGGRARCLLLLIQHLPKPWRRINAIVTASLILGAGMVDQRETSGYHRNHQHSFHFSHNFPFPAGPSRCLFYSALNTSALVKSLKLCKQLPRRITLLPCC